MMTFEQRVGLLRVVKEMRAREDVDAAICWIEQQLDTDGRQQDAARRAREWSAAGLCSRCGSDDGGPCICYAR